MGAQDNFGMAEEFVERTGTATPLMIWDASFETWSHYDVRGQPTAVLVDPNGAELGRWFGLTREMVDLVEQYTS